MRARERKRLQKTLQVKRADLLGRVKEIRSSVTEGNDLEAPDLGDRALTSITRDLKYQLTTGEREIVRRIDAALDRIDAGTYGECVHCGKKVQLGRLEAVPWARHCIECQELQDRGEI
jgi:DnaK suppressor protein